VNAPRRVAHVVHDLRIGGAERRMVGVLAALDRERYAPSLYCLDGLGPLADDVRALGIEPVVVGRSRRRDPRSFLELARLVRRDRIDLVHGWLFLPNVYARLGGRLGGARAIVVAEGGGVITFDRRRSRAIALVDRLLAPLANVVVANSETVAANLRRTAVPARELVVIPNGVPQREPLAPEERRRLRASVGAADDELLVIMVARLDPEFKDHETLLDAVALLRLERIRVVIAGDGPGREQLERRARALGLDGVVFTGFRNDASELMGAMDVSVLLSFSEGLSNVVLDSLAWGLPTIVTDIPPNREAAGDAALYVSVGDVAATAGALEQVLTGQALAEELGARGRLRATRFSPEEQGRRTMELYDRLLVTRRPR
jgi:glycosyltransferase involved in cell wall biosynthesis